MLAGILVETLHWILAQDSREVCVVDSGEDSALDFMAWVLAGILERILVEALALDLIEIMVGILFLILAMGLLFVLGQGIWSRVWQGFW